MTRRSCSTLESTGSSSTTRIRSVMLATHRKGHGHRGAETFRTTDGQPSTMIRDDSVRDREPQSGAARTRLLAAKVARRELQNLLVVDADTFVDDVHEHYVLRVVH